MKAKILTRVNTMIAFFLTALGFGSCGWMQKYGIPDPDIVAEYGCPYATFEARGKVTGENAKPVENIRVRIKNKYGSELQELYTDKDGEYNTGTIEGVFPPDSVDIIVADTAGIYAPDSVRVKVEYDRSGVPEGNHWDEGKATVEQDFQLTKKD